MYVLLQYGRGRTRVRTYTYRYDERLNAARCRYDADVDVVRTRVRTTKDAMTAAQLVRCARLECGCDHPVSAGCGGGAAAHA